MAQFKKRCTTCPLRARCTTSTTGRNVNVHPHHDLLAAARRQAATDSAWQADHRCRPSGRHLAVP
ncbi:transposase [Streptosporangium sp. NPDC052375]|uniref:transposase n=1 Tax=Streptosporangium sp. NPDC052375 TaxID=3366195 RepID=UPI0037CDED77